MKKENEKPLEVDKSLKTLDYPESYYNIFIYKMNEKQSKKFVANVDRIFPEFKKKMSKKMKKTLKEIKKKKNH